MTGAYIVQEHAQTALLEIYAYTIDQWGEDQAKRYAQGMFERFEKIARREIHWRAIPAEFGVEGYFCKYQSHFIYWRTLDDAVGIAAVVHERMHGIERVRAAFGP